MELIDGVEFITVDKRAGLAAGRDLRASLRGRRFDALLHMQLSLRASLLSRLVPATVRLVFDRARARELQWLFTNARIAPRSHEHVLDSFFGFVEALGIHERTLRWDIPLPSMALDYAQIVRRFSADGRRPGMDLGFPRGSQAARADRAVRVESVLQAVLAHLAPR